MHEQATEQKNNYFRELTLNLRHEGFTAGQPEDALTAAEYGVEFITWERTQIRTWRASPDRGRSSTCKIQYV